MKITDLKNSSQIYQGQVRKTTIQTHKVVLVLQK